MSGLPRRGVCGAVVGAATTSLRHGAHWTLCALLARHRATGGTLDGGWSGCLPVLGPSGPCELPGCSGTPSATTIPSPSLLIINSCVNCWGSKNPSLEISGQPSTPSSSMGDSGESLFTEFQQVISSISKYLILCVRFC